jgi:hypothetical protein
MLKAMIEKLKKAEAATAAERGAYALFALFLRKDAPGRWDLLVSAPWIEANTVLVQPELGAGPVRLRY